MIDKIIDLVKGQVTNVVANDADIPEEKKQDTVHAATNSLMDGLKQYLTPDNIPALMSLLGKGATGTQGVQTGGMLSGIETKVVAALTSKVGLKPALAQKIASTVIPAVMSVFSKKVNDEKDSGFNLSSLIGSLTGNKGAEGTSGHTGGLMDMIGGFFGKK